MKRTEPRLVLGRYRLLDEIAVGGTARVHRARDEQLGREVAVKLLHPHLLPDERSRRRLEAEARAAARLSHPGIAAVYDVDADSEAPALVMELVKGESLAARLAGGGRLPAGEVARIGADVADALYLAHRNGIVHRDVKPGNILLERDGRVRLVDFGIAQSLAPGTESLTQTGTTLGTPRYMSPEQMAGSPAGPRSDLWSLGVVLYEALAGRVPFDGPTPLAIARQQQAGPPALPARVHPPIASLVAACLAHRVEDRPIHAGAVAQALRTGDSGSLASTTVTWLAPPAAEPGHAEAAPPAPRARRRSVPLWTALVGAAGLALLGAALLAGPPREAADAPASAAPTAEPTPDWVTALAAAHLDACGEPIDTERLEEMSPDEGEAWVDELVADCLEDDEGEDEGRGRGNEGRGNGNEGNEGNGNGNGGGPGRGNNGGGNGRGG